MTIRMLSSAALIVLATLSGPSLGSAQDRVVLPRGWHVGKVRVVRAGETGRPGILERGLTVRKRFETPDYTDDSDPLEFGAVEYGNIRTFNPFPTVTSGTQLPYGLDGIGGFGSDIGFSAGADSALYDRGG